MSRITNVILLHSIFVTLAWNSRVCSVQSLSSTPAGGGRGQKQNKTRGLFVRDGVI